MQADHDCQGASCKCWDPYGARCKVKGCNKPVKAKGRCQSHYGYWWQYQRPGGKRCQVPSEVDGTPCNCPAIANGLCMRHYQRQRLYGSLQRRRRKFDQAAQRAVLNGMRQGMTLADAARAAGWNPRSVKSMAMSGRRNERSSLRWFATEVDLIYRMQEAAYLSPEGRQFLEGLERQTGRSLQQDSSRWAWTSSTSSGPRTS